jgi:7,8-dihydropterin-6-yl-methyl-4-(beta-D-ribofuranosyl)aminobenzene 5'-phosphate synthase
VSSDRSHSLRRDEVLRGGVALIGALAAPLLTAQPSADAAQPGLAVPEIDRLAVRVVTDNYQFAVAPSSTAGTVAIQRFGWGLSQNPPSKTLVSEFGLALHAEAHRGSEVRNVLVDFGYTPEALNTNLAVLGIDPAQLDALVLSHGHYDHFGGMAGFLQANAGKLKANLPLYLGGEEAFCARQWTGPPTPGNFGALDRAAIQNAHVNVVYAEKPTRIADLAFTPGRLAQTSFEKILAPSTMKIGPSDGVGCNAAAFTPVERAAVVVPDQFRHEIPTAFNLKNRGLVVLTSCSHRGVLNAIAGARAASGINHVHAVIGGFHLAPYPEDYVRAEVAALKDADVDYVIPLHCTGDTFYEIAKQELGKKVLRSYSGTRFVFT